MRRVLVTGATGFIGRALVPALVERGLAVRATTRGRLPESSSVEWVRCDVEREEQLGPALTGVDTAYFLVHGMAGGHPGYAEAEAHAARRFRELAAEKGVRRIIYLGGVAPQGEPSVHLASRLQVGALLRGGAVPTLELRASMIIGPGSASWQVVRDLALRLPVMVLPSWTESRTCPVALTDVVGALLGALDVPLEASTWFDLPGPDVLTGRDILMRLARLEGRRVPAVPVPFLSVSLSSWWLKLVTRADFGLARELVLGFTSDLLPRDDRFWQLIDAPPRTGFDAAARDALAREQLDLSVRGVAGAVEEALVGVVGRRLARR
jgi:uncharacterized protein YbjT (DUF2867 family)